MIDVCKREKQNKSPAKCEELSHAGHAHLIPIQCLMDTTHIAVFIFAKTPE